MQAFHPYITFDGNCEEALNFYAGCLGGKIIYMQYYDEAAAFGSEAFRSKVMHSEFKAGPVHFMACDRSSDQRVHFGTNLTLYISFDTREEQERTFGQLSRGGKIQLAPEETIYGATVGVLTDPFGIHWMLVYNA